jgi:hypothetical protein
VTDACYVVRALAGRVVVRPAPRPGPEATHQGCRGPTGHEELNWPLQHSSLAESMDSGSLRVCGM